MSSREDSVKALARIEQWSYAEVAAHLGTATSTVRKYAATGRLPAPDGRVGGSPWWHPETIRAWHESRPGRGVGGGRRRNDPA